MKLLGTALALAAFAQQPPSTSPGHFKTAEVLFEQGNLISAAAEYKAAIASPDTSPEIAVWSHIQLGRIFDRTGQRARAVESYCAAIRTGDNTRGAQSRARELLDAFGVKPIVPAHTGAAPQPTAPAIPEDAYVPPRPLEVLERIEPAYPPEAREQQVEGRVVISGVVDVDGRMRDAKVTQSIGFGLDESALAAVAQWRFAPAWFDGRNVPAVVQAPVDFFLPARDSRWHLLGFGCAGVPADRRPSLRKTSFPPGSGITVAAAEHAQIVAMLRRVAQVDLSFEVKAAGHPTNIRVESATDAHWGPEAAAVIAGWEFNPVLSDPGSAPRCGVRLAWGPRDLTGRGDSLRMPAVESAPTRTACAYF